MKMKTILFLFLLLSSVCLGGGFSTGNNASDFQLDLSLGRITGMSTLNKFGRNIEIDNGVTADIWDGGYTVASGGTSLIWVAPTAARTHVIDSDNGGDTSAGAGARTVRIYGLTSWNSAEVSEDITLNDASPPSTENSYVIIHRMKVLTKGATNVNIGNITATAAAPDSTVTARILAGQGQTQMAIYGVPSTQDAYITNVYANANKAQASGSVDISLDVNPEPQTELTNFLVKHTFGLQTTGSSAYDVHFHLPKKIEGPAIIKIQAVAGANDMDVSAGFDLILVTK
jgi:hypothetical protein